MAETYTRRHGIDFPKEMSPVFIDLLVAKKHREMKASHGFDVARPWEIFLDAARALVDASLFTVSPYTEEHAHDFVMHNQVITWGGASCGKAQPLDAIVMTPYGPRRMGDVQVGDLVSAPGGRSVVVTKTHDVGEVDEYKVTMLDGGSTLCAGDHLWRRCRQVGSAKPDWGTVRASDLSGCRPGSIGFPSHEAKGLPRLVRSVEATGRTVRMKCITVGSTDGLYLTDDFIVTHNSNDYGLFAILDWITDPYFTLWLVGSTTMKDLNRRTWEAMVRYFYAIQNNKLGVMIPGKLSSVGTSLTNVEDKAIPESMGEKAGVMGVALNEQGRLQGSHLPYVRILVDELATIRDHDTLKMDTANLRVGTRDFRFFGLANPSEWSDPSCQYCMPADGRKVDVDTGLWMSTRGFLVRHHDNLKSPCMVDPSTEDKYPYLFRRANYVAILQQNDGNEDSPEVWKMVRGFPPPAGSTVPTVLDPKVAASMKVSEPPASIQRWEGSVAGVDPAWSEGGDAAVYARCDIVWSDNKPVLDFSGRVHRIPIQASSGVPVMRQQREFVSGHLRGPGAPRLKCVAVDSSGNQGLADDLDMYVGAGCLHVNNSERASDLPVRAVGTGAPAKDSIFDRGTESWVVLAEFCRAGQVRGLPANALRALTTRRFKMKSRDTVQTPLRLESKDDFSKRFGGSPNDADACALAALAAKERFGLMPYGGILPVPDEDASLGQYQPFSAPPPVDVGAGGEPEFAETYEPG